MANVFLEGGDLSNLKEWLSNFGILFVRTCFQISENSSFGVREFLEEFLSKWSCVDEQYYVLLGAEENADRRTRFGAHSILQVDEYLEVVEVYVMKLLATILNDLNSAISWVEKASIPEEKRQVGRLCLTSKSLSHTLNRIN